MNRDDKLTHLRRLIWDDLEEWAGATIAKRGQRYHSDGRVQSLALTADGALLAWVAGSQRYATLVDYDEGGLTSACTCPYGATCKHAVAVALAYRSAVSQQQKLPTASDDDPRLVLLEDDADDWDEDDWEADDSTRQDQALDSLHTFLEGLTQAELLELLESLAQRFPEVRSALEARRVLASGSVAELVRDTRRLIASVSAEPGWRNEWNGEGVTPDYTEVRDRLELLLRQGHADAVVGLGEELLEAGRQQVEQSHDEGETSLEVASCLDIAFQALGQSSLAPAEQMLRAIDWELRDSYDLCESSSVFWAQPRAAADWSIVADSLLKRLAALPAPREKAQARVSGRRTPIAPASPARIDFFSAYERERVSDRVVYALEQAGRNDEIIPLCEREAQLNGSYVRLVQRLIAAGRRAEAERWIITGIAALDQHAPGLSAQLREIQGALWEQGGDWLKVAALRAEAFFQSPAMSTLIALRTAAQQAAVWPAVRAAALRYLETGDRPAHAERRVAGTTIPPWPLPGIDWPREERRWSPQFPQLNVLIELAVDERRPDEVLRWYDQRRAGAGGWLGINHDMVAEAVAATHPDRAIAIWKQLAEAQIAQTSPRSYETAAAYLRKLKRLLERARRMDEWRRYVAALREANKRKRRLLEILDRI